MQADEKKNLLIAAELSYLEWSKSARRDAALCDAMRCDARRRALDKGRMDRWRIRDEGMYGMVWNGLSNWRIVCLLIGEWNGDARSFRRRGGGRRESIGERERERRVREE